MASVVLFMLGSEVRGSTMVGGGWEASRGTPEAALSHVDGSKLSMNNGEGGEFSNDCGLQ